ncbi:hypothetical protein SAMN02745166_01070 [Prosthecobacter debontii]|uniref:Uncharacterized protein n=1 Tax=Prosthecobacter debontii TaxID=48467 RepID=A0A1T4X5H8_9BACT|nr:hypothetical protein [Prosthecobacter debontii]SKA84874.1 hypothetical protein SAMN02745166_01070 [Prosthecobacter debontii]
MTDTLAPPKAAAPSAQTKSRASDPTKALAMIQARVRALEPRLEVYREVENAYDRVPPDDENALRLDGLGWTANVDWGGMEAGINEGADIDWNLATQPETYVKFTRADNIPASLVNVTGILEEADKELLDGWGEWLNELEMMVHNRRAHGLGIFHFPHPHGWHFRSLHPGNLITPHDTAKLNPDSWMWFAIKTEFEITDLLTKLAKKEDAAKLGWNPSAISKAIAHYAKDGGSSLVSQIWRDPESYSMSLQSNDLFFAQENKGTIPGFIFYVKEWDGGVSEHFLTEEEGIGFIYSKVGRHKRMSEVLALFPLGLGQGYVQNVRGYGIKMLPFHDIENRNLNKAVDTTWIASNMTFQGDSGDLSEMNRIQINGPFTFFDKELEVNQTSFANPAVGLLGLQQEFRNMASVRNRASGGADYSHLRGGEKTATQSRIEYQMTQGAKTNEVARFYLQLKHFHTIRCRRILDRQMTDQDPGGAEARAMLEQVKSKGVTDQDIQSIQRIGIRTIFGDGDPINQFLALMDLKEFYGTMSEDAKEEFRFDVFHSRLRDREKAETFSGRKKKADHALALHRWNAQNENNIFETSDTRIDVRPDDVHLIHAGEHTVYAEEVYQRLEQGALSNRDAFQRVARCEAHCSVHLNLLGADKFAAEQWKDLNRRWADLRNRQAQLQQRIQEEDMQRQRQQLEELRNPQPSVKDRETAATEALKRELEAQRHSLTVQQMKERHELDMQLAKGGETAKSQAAALKEAQAIPSEGNSYGRIGAPQV